MQKAPAKSMGEKGEGESGAQKEAIIINININIIIVIVIIIIAISITIIMTLCFWQFIRRPSLLLIGRVMPFHWSGIAHRLSAVYSDSRAIARFGPRQRRRPMEEETVLVS